MWRSRGSSSRKALHFRRISKWYDRFGHSGGEENHRRNTGRSQIPERCYTRMYLLSHEGLGYHKVHYNFHKFNLQNEWTCTKFTDLVQIGRARKYGWPNAYAFTKAMGEMLLGHMKGDNIPLVIIRPTIVTSTYKEPFPGWLEGVRYWFTPSVPLLNTHKVFFVWCNLITSH